MKSTIFKVLMLLFVNLVVVFTASAQTQKGQRITVSDSCIISVNDVEIKIPLKPLELFITQEPPRLVLTAEYEPRIIELTKTPIVCIEAEPSVEGVEFRGRPCYYCFSFDRMLGNILHGTVSIVNEKIPNGKVFFVYKKGLKDDTVSKATVSKTESDSKSAEEDETTVATEDSSNESKTSDNKEE